MKTLAIISILLLSNFGFSQTWDQKYESMAFESKSNPASYYTSTLTITSDYTVKMYDIISKRFLDKDGIFKLDIGEKENTLIVYHKEEIVFETLKELLSGLSENLTFEISEPFPFQF